MARARGKQTFEVTLPAVASGWPQTLEGLRRQRCSGKATSLSAEAEAVMQRDEFFLAMAFAVETVIKPSLDFGLPRWIIHAEALTDVGSQIQTFIHWKIVPCALEFNKAHSLIILG
jgi:hypothetical protein